LNAESSDKVFQAHITEYIQGNEVVRHFDKIEWTIGSIFIPVSLGLLGLSFTDPVIKFSPSSLIVLSLASFSLYLIFVSVDVRYSWFGSVAFERLRAIEKELGMDLHTSIHSRDHKQSMRLVRTIRFLIVLVFAFLILAWILRFLCN
jgi:hypothetical protein